MTNKKVERERTRRLEESAAVDIVRAKLVDSQTPGFQAEFDPDEADVAGAFEDDALDEHDALDAANDLTHESLGAGSMFIDPEEVLEVPFYITRPTLREAIARRPGESLKEALVRLQSERG
jgi:hypothetical protein